MERITITTVSDDTPPTITTQRHSVDKELLAQLGNNIVRYVTEVIAPPLQWWFVQEGA